MMTTLLAAAALNIVTNGQPCAYVQLTHYPSSMELLAARELHDVALRSWKVDLPWLLEPGAERPGLKGRMAINLRTVRDGVRRDIPGDVWAKLQATDNPEAYVYSSFVRPDGRGAVYIVGKSDMATLYGTYAFMEDRLGVRFFHPGPAGTVYPYGREASVPEGLFVFREPWASFRKQSTWFGCVKPLDIVKDVEPYQTRRTFQYREYWSRQNLDAGQAERIRMGSLACTGGGELMFSIGVPLSLFESHPEYFPLVDGQRSREAGDKKMRRCMSNPDVMELMRQYALRHLESADHFGIDYRDASGGWCECEKCRAYGTGTDGVYRVQNVAHRFTKELSEKVLAVRPDAKFDVLVYRDYREPVSNDVKFSPAVLAKYCPHQRCYAHPLTAPCNAYFRRQYDFWNERCPTFGIFDYYAYSNVQYCPLEYVLAEDFKYYMNSNFRLWLEDTSGGCVKWPFPVCNWQMFYVASKMFWDKSVEAKPLMDEAYTFYYGAAADVMKKYHACRLELWNACPAHAAMSNFQRNAYCLNPKGSRERLLGYLDEAEKLAASDAEVRTRIGIDRDMLTAVWIKRNDALREALEKQRPMDVRRRSGAIAIDGELDDAGWKDAFVADGFLDVKSKCDDAGRKAPAQAKTRVRATYDDDAWYFAFEAMTDGRSPVAKATERDGDLWLDDSVEAFVTPPYDGYFHLIANAKGVLYDAEGQSGSDYDSRAEVKAKVLPDRYIVEMRVPVKPMRRDRIEKGDAWQVHFFRNDSRLKEISSIDGVWPHASTGFRRVDVK